MNLHWAINRLRAMPARELGYRGRQYLRAQWQRAGFGRAGAASAGAERGRPWVGVLPEGFAVDRYLAAAELILSGRFTLFGNREWSLGFPPDWNRDPQTGKCAPLVFGKRLNYRDPRVVGNIKYLWELNRHLEIVTLAQAWRLTGEARFAQGCRTLVDSWIRDCPSMMGANWCSSLELGLRLVNWSCAWHLLDGDGSPIFRNPDGAAFKERWLNAVRQHCHFIAGHRSCHSSANNHLLGELLGLIVGATTWPCWPESAQWRVRALQQFEAQALKQNGRDGVNKEQAIWYQHEVADMMLLAGLTAAANDAGFGEAFWGRLELMLEFIASCMDAGGAVPALGDSDDAVIVRFSPAPDLCVYRSLLATGSVLFGRGDFKFKAGGFDDKSRWLLGDAAAAKYAQLGSDGSGTRLPRSFPSGGYYILGSDFETAREVRMVVDAAPLGYLAIAAHGHADALSFTLSVAGLPMLIDPGTYCYHTQPRWREYFRGTSAHNTVRIDGANQSVSAGSFLWARHANARCVVLDTDAGRKRIVAEHDGYQRLDDPVLHRREIVYERASAAISVTDSIVCRSTHHVEIFWHFAAECAVTLGAGVARAERGPVVLTLQWPALLQARLVRGQDEPCLGWVSPRFEEKLPTHTLVVSGTVAAGWQGVTALGIAIGGEQLT
jgi:hypothetical protein